MRGAELCGADLRGANLAKTDFVNANLTRADLRGTNLSTADLTEAVFCQTRRPNGKLDNSGCPPDGEVCCGDAECDGVCHRGACLDGSCLSLGQVCSEFWGAECCDPAECRSTAGLYLTTCQYLCESDQECQEKFHTQDLQCVVDIVACFALGSKCCLAKTCTQDSDCATSHTCCAVSDKFSECCLPNQHCGAFGCVDN